MTGITNKLFTILLVDDREENLVSLQELLDGNERKFLLATSGNEALKIALKNDEIGLIMLDVQMPGMDGFEVARILKSNARTREIAIIFVTAINTSNRFVMQGFSEGAVDYLQKPLDVNITQAKVTVFEKLYRYQQELKLSNNKLVRVNKQLERFVYMVSHDLKSPLSSIISLMSLIKDSKLIKDDEKLQEYVDMVYIGTNHLSELISLILEYSRQSYEQQTLEEVDTSDLVSEVFFLLFPPANIKLELHHNLPVFTTRKPKLRQVFQNLLSNAIKYIDKPEGLIEVGVDDKPGFYVFWVKDNGPGILQNDRDQIFKLFSVAGNKSNNDTKTGVGLNILKMSVEEQGGSIWVDSTPGEGSTFFFEWTR